MYLELRCGPLYTDSSLHIISFKPILCLENKTNLVKIAHEHSWAGLRYGKIPVI